MSYRIPWKVTDAAGNANTSAVVKLYYMPSDTEFGGVGNGTFVSNGDGTYYKEVGTTGRYRIRVDGVIKHHDFFHVGDDAFDLLVFRNAPKLFIIDTADRFTGTTVEDGLIEVPTFAELLSAAAGKGAALVGSEDNGGFFAGNTVEEILQELGPVYNLLNTLTSTALELNKLDGTSGNVTAANLNQLTGGSTTVLHGHQMASWFDDKIGSGTTSDDPAEFSVYGREGDVTPGRGKVILNTFHADGSSRSWNRRANEDGSDTQFDYKIADSWVADDTNWSGDPLLGNVTGPDKHGQALRTLSQAMRSVQISAGVQYVILDSLGQSAGAADTNTAADPRATTLYYDKTATYVRKRRWSYIQLPDHKSVTLRTFTKGDVGSLGYIKLVISTESYELKIVPTAYTETTLTVDVRLIPVLVPTFRDIEIWLHGDGAGNGAYMASWLDLRVEI